MRNEKLISIDDFHTAARMKMTTPILAYYQAGADTCSTTSRNSKAFSLIKLKQHVLQGKLLEKFDMSTTLFGKKISSPICIAPVGLQKMAHPDGEIAVMKAAQKRGTAYALSTGSTVQLEKVTTHCPSVPKIMQLYNFKTEQQNREFFKRIESASYDGIAVTVDTPVLSMRRAESYTSFSLPPHLKFMNLENDANNMMQQKSYLPGETFIQYYIRVNHDLQLDWESIKRLRKLTKLKLIIKGIMSGQDAAIAAEYAKQGIFDAVWVSNHGGRQLDEALSTIEVLPQIVSHLKGIVPIWIDGGIRKGTDVLKALALGADLVFIGRPIIWGLAALGQEGVEAVLSILESQLRRAMILTGVTNLQEVRNKNILYGKVPKL